MASDALPIGKDEEEPLTEPTTPGGSQETNWEVVTKTAGLVPAQIIAERLQSEGIPARAWQEGAGQAFGLTVGLLGTGHVIVPKAYVEQAKAILAAPAEDDGLDDFKPDDRQFEESDFAESDLAESEDQA